MAQCDLAHFAQIRRINSELVLCALFKVVLVIIEQPFTFEKKNEHLVSMITFPDLY